MPAVLLALLLSGAAHAETWWVADPDAAAHLERALSERWPGVDHAVTVGEPGGDGLWWDGERLVEHRDGGARRAAPCPAAEVAALLARSWSVPVAVPDGAWVPQPRAAMPVEVAVERPRGGLGGAVDVGLGVQASLDEPGPLQVLDGELGWSKGALRLSAGVGWAPFRPGDPPRGATSLRQELQSEQEALHDDGDLEVLEQHVLADRFSVRLAADVGPRWGADGVHVSPRALAGWEVWFEEDLVFTAWDVERRQVGFRAGPVVGAVAELGLGAWTLRAGATARAPAIDSLQAGRAISPALLLDARVTL